MTTQNRNEVMKRAQHTNPHYGITYSGDEEWLSLNEIITAYAPVPDLSGYTTTADFVDQLGLKADVTSVNNYADKQAFNDAAQLLDERVTANENENVSKVNATDFYNTTRSLHYGITGINVQLDNKVEVETLNEHNNIDNLQSLYTTATNVNDAFDTKGDAMDNLDDRVQNIEYGFSTAFNDPLWNMTDLGDNKTF